MSLFNCRRMLTHGLLFLCCGAVTAQEKAAETRVAATVNESPITVAEIRREVQRVTAGRKVDVARGRQLAQAALAQAINRRVVLSYLDRRKLGASPQEIEQELDNIKRKLAEQEITLADYIVKAGLSEEELRYTVSWKIGWSRYLTRFLTDANLQKYFSKHRRDFDGTKLRVAHILWQVDVKDSSAVKEAVAKANKVRSEIVAGTLSFADAARQHSAAPTSKQGGDIGVISRHEPMSEVFSRTAFALEQGKVSEPITSPFGVHLIRCIKIEPGQQTWEDVRGELREAIVKYLFDWTVKQEKPRVKIDLRVDLTTDFSLDE